MEEAEAVLSPVVFCEPNGLVFKEPVTLTLPHCAANVHNDWQLSIYQSQTDVRTEPVWRPMQIGDYDSRIISMYLLKDLAQERATLGYENIAHEILTTNYD